MPGTSFSPSSPSLLCSLTHSCPPPSPWSLNFAGGLWGYGQGPEAWRRKRSHNEKLPSTCPWASLSWSLATSMRPTLHFTLFLLLPLVLDTPSCFLACPLPSLVALFGFHCSTFMTLNLSPIRVSALLSWGPLYPGPPLSLLLPAQPGPQSMGGKQPDSLGAAGSCSSRG